MLKEFKQFIMRGNVIDLAVGIIIGGAFGKIITSLVDDIIMPPFGMLFGKVDFTNLFLSLDGNSYASLAAAKTAGAATWNYGLFINALINFLIIAFAIFLLIKQVNRMQKPAAVEEPKMKDCPHCQTAIPLKATRCPHCTSQL
jgi:large conductance mechanosensitive channel